MHGIAIKSDSLSIVIVCRQFNEDVEMVCTLKISTDTQTMNYPWRYKYVIYSPKMSIDNDCWEYVHSCMCTYNAEQPIIRYLLINPNDLESMLYANV